MSRFDHGISAHVLFALPAGVGEEWRKAESWRIAESIPGVDVKPDVAGAEAALFGARTSGHVVLYDGEGQLQFSGGITAARGHLGDNAGLDSISSALDGTTSPRGLGPVYGCPLGDPEE